MAIKTDVISFPIEDGQGHGYLALPEEEGPHRAVVVIQEWWGLNDQIKGVVERFAAEGYVALAPDLYHGTVVSEPDDARKQVMAMQMAQAVKELVGAAACLASREDVSPKRVGVVGFCMGGSLALVLAGSSDNVGAVVSYYGIPRGPEAEERLRQIRVPVLGIFGSEDESIPLERRQELESIFNQTGVSYEVKVYAEAGHAFANEQRDAFRPDAAQDAWRRTLHWFDSYLAE